MAVGDTLTWVNVGQIQHTTTDTPGRAAVPEHDILPLGADPWDSATRQTGETFRQVLTVPGEYTYLCLLHEVAGMVGYVTVR